MSDETRQALNEQWSMFSFSEKEMNIIKEGVCFSPYIIEPYHLESRWDMDISHKCRVLSEVSVNDPSLAQRSPPSVVCLSEISKFQQLGGLGPRSTATPQKKE